MATYNTKRPVKENTANAPSSPAPKTRHHDGDDFASPLADTGDFFDLPLTVWTVNVIGVGEVPRS